MIEVGVVGAGAWGPNLIRNFHRRPASVVRWVVDLDDDRLAQVRERFPDVRTGRDVAEMLGDGAVQAVVIATPTSTHHALVREALLAGKHVLVEKPMATTRAQAEDLCTLAERTGKVLMVGHIFLHNLGIRRVKRYIDEGDLGRVFYVAMVRTNLGPIRRDVNAAWDLAAHDISIANYWFDELPRFVTAVGGTWINHGTEDTVFAVLHYPNGVIVHLHVSWLNPRKAREITVVGEHRMLTFDDMNLSEPLRLYDKRVAEAPSYVDSFGSFRASVREGDIVVPRVLLGEPLLNECDHFLECIASGRRPIGDATGGLRVVQVLEAIQRSIRNRGAEEAV